MSADGYETSIQSVGGIDFEIGSSSDLDITLMQGNDPDPGILSGTVYSNIDGNQFLRLRFRRITYLQLNYFL